MLGILRNLRQPAVAPDDATSPVARVAASGDDANDVAPVLDALRFVLALYGRHAVDTDTLEAEALRRELEQWVKHATIGAPSPASGSDRPAGAMRDRDWKGLVQRFGVIRRDEHDFVVRSMGDLRESVWAFVSAVHKVVVDDHSEGKKASEQLDRLRAAVEDPSTERLRKETLAVTASLESMMMERRQRHRQQFTALARQLKTTASELETARREVSLDALTGLPNRKAFDDQLARSVEFFSLIGRAASLMIVDVDSFKGLNDSFGHAYGDESLRLVGRALARTFLRKADFVCRLGGDEFAAILQETPREAAVDVGLRLQRTLRGLQEALPENACRSMFTLSIGVAELEFSDTPQAWFERADQTLYRAKSEGRDRVVAAARTEAVRAQDADAELVESL